MQVDTLDRGRTILDLGPDATLPVVELIATGKIRFEVVCARRYRRTATQKIIYAITSCHDLRLALLATSSRCRIRFISGDRSFATMFGYDLGINDDAEHMATLIIGTRSITTIEPV
ncbi:MAG TPA: hypothetical protein VJK53_04765 [Candidatus Paceibacterota bacterium]